MICENCIYKKEIPENMYCEKRLEMARAILSNKCKEKKEKEDK